MFFGVTIVLLFIAILAAEIFFLSRIKQKVQAKKERILERYSCLKEKEKIQQVKIVKLEHSLAERFLFYDLARKIAPILDKKELLSVFSNEIRRLGRIEKFEFFDSNKDSDCGDIEAEKNCSMFELGKGQDQVLKITTKSNNILEYMPFFVKLLRLCLERIKLYNKLQELSTLDRLTMVYNRRHFMLRYQEEFKRAKEFKLNLAFLMIDIDHFKKINDTYGHLVGDAALREVARVIRENIREIDFLARFGGEEFSIVLPEADKASAIMAAERINSRVSRKRIRVFDEVLSVNISVGLAAFPQNTLYPDVLIEAADKALYKAKLSGKNRVCWF